METGSPLQIIARETKNRRTGPDTRLSAKISNCNKRDLLEYGSRVDCVRSVFCRELDRWQLINSRTHPRAFSQQKTHHDNCRDWDQVVGDAREPLVHCPAQKIAFSDVHLPNYDTIRPNRNVVSVAGVRPEIYPSSATNCKNSERRDCCAAPRSDSIVLTSSVAQMKF